MYNTNQSANCGAPDVWGISVDVLERKTGEKHPCYF